MADDIVAKIRKLPEPIQDFILAPEGIDVLENIFIEEKISEKDSDVITDIVTQVLLKELSLSEFVDMLQKKAPDLSQDTIKRIALKIIGNRFLPVEDYLGGGVTELIRNLGGDPASFNVKRVEIKSVSPKEAAAEILLESGLKFEDPFLAKRTQEIIEMRLREVRDDFETAAALVRGKKIGGADLSEDDAKKIIDSIKAKLLKTQIETEEQKPIKPISPIRPISSPGPSGPVGRPSGAEVYGVEEEREVSHIKKEMEKKLGKETLLSSPLRKGKLKGNLEESISKILKQSKAETKGADFISKLRNIAVARLHDIRDKAETKETLTKHPKLGGLGLTSQEAEKLSGIIEQEFRLLTQKQKEKVTAEMEEVKKQEKISRAEKKKMAEEKEKEELNKRWMQLVRKTVPQKETKPSRIIRPIEMPKEVEDIRSKIAPPPSPVDREEDKLIGPIEELKKMTLDDFRKLSSKPSEAALKIKSKINLLASEDISKKIAGINAWKQSEVLKIYFEILKESIMNGKPVSQVISEKTAQNQPVLTEDEFKVIVELNRELKI